MDVLKSAEYIGANAQHVKISEAGVKKAAEFILGKFKASGYSTKAWKMHPLNPSTADERSVEWIFLVDLLNFSFYSTLPKGAEFAIEYNGKKYTGYWSLCAAVNRALDENIPITSASYMANITEDQLRYVFRRHPNSKEDIPLFDERLKLLRESGTVLEEKFGGLFANCILRAERSAQKLLELVVNNFASFRDEHIYKGQKVQIFKRAQILIADVWACFEGREYGEFYDIDSITMFADYRVPQSLCAVGAMVYTDELHQTLQDPNHQLASGDEREVEIRGCSIWAVELIRRKIVELGSNFAINAILIDFFLWDYAKANPESLAAIPIHHTRSVFY